MELTINGESRQFSAPLSVAALVEVLGFTGKRIAIERNGEIEAIRAALIEGEASGEPGLFDVGAFKQRMLARHG